MWGLEGYWKINEKSGEPNKNCGKYKIFDDRLRNGYTPCTTTNESIEYKMRDAMAKIAKAEKTRGETLGSLKALEPKKQQLNK